MSNGSTIVLVTDRPDRSCNLADRLNTHYACHTVSIDEQANISDRIVAIITDVHFRRPATIECLRRLVALPCMLGAVILAVLRNDSHLERVQAAATGATLLLPPNAKFADISAALKSALRSTVTPSWPVAMETLQQKVEQAKSLFGLIFSSAMGSEAINRTDVEKAVGSVISALSENGVRQWLEIVWQYDNRTYQHCLLVTGLAAEFARVLKFSTKDQRLLTSGALLHDIGKARIPLAILNKPDALTAEEAALMRTHPDLGYAMLRAQGEYPPELLDVVLRHHEMLDGSGYPDGITGAQISDLVRLATICDIYAALIERRPYRPAIDPAQAFKTLQEMEGKLEPALVRAFAPVAERLAASLTEPGCLSAA